MRRVAGGIRGTGVRPGGGLNEAGGGADQDGPVGLQELGGDEFVKRKRERGRVEMATVMKGGVGGG